MILMIDNYDSFTYNLVQYLGELKYQVHTVRNDEISLDEISHMNPDYIVLSPGPCTPNQAGVSLSVVQHFMEKIPILGVCLGYQTIGQALGGSIIGANQIMHGKISSIKHINQGMFKNLPNPITATRYHSLAVDKSTLPDVLEITAWSVHADGSMDEIMGFRHKYLPIEGVQFHPESIMTECGHQMLENFLIQHKRS